MIAHTIKTVFIMKFCINVFKSRAPRLRLVLKIQLVIIFLIIQEYESHIMRACSLSHVEINKSISAPVKC